MGEKLSIIRPTLLLGHQHEIRSSIRSSIHIVKFEARFVARFQDLYIDYLRLEYVDYSPRASKR